MNICTNYVQPFNIISRFTKSPHISFGSYALPLPEDAKDTINNKNLSADVIELFPSKNIYDGDISNDNPVRILSKDEQNIENCKIIEILGDRYYFKTDKYDKSSDDSIAKMAENILETQRGRFVRVAGHEKFIPNIFTYLPDIKYEETSIKYGNGRTKVNYDTICAAEKLKEIIGDDITADDLKTIRYLVFSEDGFDNNKVAEVYGYHDIKTDTLYLYLPESKKVKKLYDNGVVRTYM